MPVFILASVALVWENTELALGIILGGALGVLLFGQAPNARDWNAVLKLGLAVFGGWLFCGNGFLSVGESLALVAVGVVVWVTERPVLAPRKSWWWALGLGVGLVLVASPVTAVLRVPLVVFGLVAMLAGGGVTGWAQGQNQLTALWCLTLGLGGIGLTSGGVFISRSVAELVWPWVVVASFFGVTRWPRAVLWGVSAVALVILWF